MTVTLTDLLHHELDEFERERSAMSITQAATPLQISRNSTAPLTVQAGQMSIGGASVGLVSDLTPYRWWWPQNHYTYVSTGTAIHTLPNPTELAFRIVAKMMGDGLVKELSVKEFVSLVDDIATIVKEN